MIVLHVDMDAFFASVEQRDHPEWRGKPVIVGAGPHERGVVSTCSYEARRFGVHSAMPSRTAFALCPQGVFVRPRMEAYEESSRRVFEILGRFSPFVEGVSVDEAFLDVTGTVHLFGSPRAMGEKLRTAVREELGLTCSVGFGPNRLLAKIASEEAKPNGLFEMPQGAAAIREWLAPRPAKILWGVGKRTGELLAKYGYRTCGDLQNADPRFLGKVLGESAASSIVAHSRGEDFTPVAYGEAEDKSVSREHTFPEDETDRETVRAALLDLAADVGQRFRREARWARTAKIKLRNADFETVTRQARFGFAARDDVSFRRLALSLLDREWPPSVCRSVRLVGFGVSDIVDAPDIDEPSLFAESASSRREKLERLSFAVDACGGAVHSGSNTRKSRPVAPAKRGL